MIGIFELSQFGKVRDQFRC